MRRFAGVLVAVTVAALAGDVAAQGQGRGRGNQNRRPIRFQEMDVNNDRVIARTEWKGSARSFQVHDWNDDGVLSGEEVRVGATQPREGTDPRDLESVWTPVQVDDWTVAEYRRLDTDRNGRVTAAEWYYDRETFRRIDHNGDNWISQAEYVGGDDVEVDDDREDLFVYLDDDNDGTVTRAEWHGTRARFDALDRDRNGVLSRAEAMGTDAPSDLFSAIDVNNDRAIARSEWRWSAASFDERDSNRDGRLSRDEFVGVTGTVTSAYKSGYDRGLTEGRVAGREDRTRNQGWDLEGQRELEQADSGYAASMGPRAEYQGGYREGFRRGYREGWDAR
ncbi:MAG: hypothetical protein M3R55_14010 [Acidobacteriota bacterium]|nr:hypothetical protein [Acidobacteriota bacterium]